MALTTRLPIPDAEPFYGFVETTGDALRLIQAARQGVIPRITRRLNDLERRAMIKSGSVFIFSKEESGIKRWTEGLSWSASRIVGNFLVYREVTERGLGRSSHLSSETHRSRRRINPNNLTSAEQADKKFERALVGCLADDRGRFKPSGLIKKTITVNIEGSEHHLIAYYRQDDVRLGILKHPRSRLDIMALGIPPELLESTKFRIPPVTEPLVDGRPHYICDADDLDPSASGTCASYGQTGDHDYVNSESPRHANYSRTPELALSCGSDGSNSHNAIQSNDQYSTHLEFKFPQNECATGEAMAIAPSFTPYQGHITFPDTATSMTFATITQSNWSNMWTPTPTWEECSFETNPSFLSLVNFPSNCVEKPHSFHQQPTNTPCYPLEPVHWDFAMTHTNSASSHHLPTNGSLSSQLDLSDNALVPAAGEEYSKCFA